MNDYIFSKNIILNIYVDILFLKINIDILKYFVQMFLPHVFMYDNVNE